jgi:lipopolysaccharide transport system ATP-binding protein
VSDDPTTGTMAIRAHDLGKQFRLIGRTGRPRRGSLYDQVAGALRRRGEDAASDPNLFWALRHVDFEVPTGEIFGVIGRNGSGKTTLLKVLAKVTAPSEGRAEVRGRVAALLQVGAGFHPQLTGRDNIALSGAILGMTPQEVEERYDRIIEFSEIGRYIDQPVKHYSSGMYVRLAFSVAAFLPAEIMLVDEVLAVGDAEFKEKSQAHMREVLRDGRTVVYVGHGMDIVRSICRDALVLDGGHVVFRGPAGDAADYYEQEVVKRRRPRAGRRRPDVTQDA